MVHISPYSFTAGVIDEDRRLTNITACTIERDATDETSLLESATVKLDSTSFSAGWYAVDALDEGTRTRLGVFYFTLSSVEQESDGSMVYELAGTSVLSPAKNVRVAGGYSVIEGNSGVATISNLLSTCTAPLDIESFQVAKTQVFNSNVTCLGACWSVLRNANMCMQITNDGTIQVKPLPTVATKEISLNSGQLTGSVSVDDNEVGYQCILNGRPYDAVYLNLPTFGILQTRYIASQSIDLSSGLTADETAKETVYDDDE